MLKNFPIFSTILALTTPLALAQTGAILPPANPVQPPQWVLEGELAIVAAAGNTQAQTYSTKQRLEYPWDRYRIREDLRYLRGRSQGLDTAEQWAFSNRLEVNFAENWRVFIGELVESDRFAGYYERYNTDLGLIYTIFKNDLSEVTAEGGYRLLTNTPVIGDGNNEQRARVALQARHLFREGLIGTLGLENLQTLDRSNNRETNASASVNFVLTKIFSLKTAYELKYRNHPATLPGGAIAKNYDGLFMTSLVAKF